MKILALSYLFPNPALPHYGIFVFNRLKAVQKFCELRVIAPLQWYPLKGRLTSWANGQTPISRGTTFLEGMEVHHPRFFVIPRYMKWFDSISYLIAILPVVRRLWQEGFHFDLIDVHWTYPDILAGYVLSSLYRKPFIVTIRGREALYLGERGGRKCILDYLLKKADAVIALSSELGRLCLKIGVASKRISVVLNGIDKEKFRLVDQKEARIRLGLDAEKKILISVGSLIEGKGHHKLISLIPELQKKFAIELFILGGAGPAGDFSKEICSIIESRSLKNVHLVGNVDHSALMDWYNAADLFCLATEGEGCPNVVMEALACGTPVVVTDVGAVRELVDTDAKGYVVPCGDMPALQDAICQSLLQQWDKYAIWASMQSMDWDSCAKNVVTVYGKVNLASCSLKNQ